MLSRLSSPPWQFTPTLQLPLAAGKELVEARRRHLPGKIRVAPDGNHPAQRLALVNADAFLASGQLDHAMPGITGRVPVGFNQRGDGAPTPHDIGDIGYIQKLVGIGFQKKISGLSTARLKIRSGNSGLTPTCACQTL